MKESEFIEYLEEREIRYEIKGDIISVLGDGGEYLDLNSLTSLPENIHFNNSRSVYLRSLTSLPESTQFNNSGGVYLNSLKSLPENIQFNNGGSTFLQSLTSLPGSTQFNNGGFVDLGSLKSLPENIQFNNGTNVYLRLLKSLPENIRFNNGGRVYLHSLMSIPESTRFNNGGNIFLNSLTSLPENIRFNNGGNIILKHKRVVSKKDYIKRYRLKVNDGKVILYKRVSKDFLTQEGNAWQTQWKIGSTLVHPDWDPRKNECGTGKFHACARPFWCDYFRHNKDDKYIAIEVKVEDLHEWTLYPAFPQKIAFREGKVLHECDRYGNKI